MRQPCHQATKFDFEIANWLENHGVDVESISDGDDTSFEKPMLVMT